MEALFTRDGQEKQPNGKTDKGAPVFRTDQNCSRCGGAGGADKWAPTGWTCYRCGGKGIDPNRLVLKLYTADKLAKLNATKAKKDAERARIAAEKAAAEAARVARERNDVLARYSELLKRIRAAAPVKYSDDDEVIDSLEGEGFLASIYRQISVQARPLSENQQDAIENTLTKIEAEKARVAAADWVGQVGERRDFVLTFEKHVTWGDQYAFGGITHLCIFKDENGSKVLYKGKSPHSLGLTLTRHRDHSKYTVGQTIRIKATVSDHARSKYNGEPETYITRPKALEEVK